MPQPRNPALDVIDQEFPETHQRFVGPALKRAYSAVDAAIEMIDFLDNPSGRLQRGDLIVKSAEFEFKKLIEAGHLSGFDPSLEDYALPTGKHLVMRTANAHITISQVPTINTRPRAATFRENFGIPNAEYLFEEMNIAAQRENARKHLLIIHGYQTLDFASVAMPHPTLYRLIARTENLIDLDAGDFGTNSPPEGPTDSPDLEAIENVVRVVRDSK